MEFLLDSSLVRRLTNDRAKRKDEIVQGPSLTKTFIATGLSCLLHRSGHDIEC